MPIEMDEQIVEEAQKHDMDYSEYVRQALRESLGTPFECDDTILCTDENRSTESQTGAA